MSDNNDQFFRQLGKLISSFPGKSITTSISLVVFIFTISWKLAKITTSPAGLRELAAVEAAYRDHSIEIPVRGNAVDKIAYFSKAIKEKYSIETTQSNSKTSWLGFKREFEYPDESTAGKMISTENASSTSLMLMLFLLSANLKNLSVAVLQDSFGPKT